MASIFKRKKTWYVALFLGGKRVVKSLKTKDAKIARFLKKEYEVKVKTGELKVEKRKLVAEYYKEYLDDITHRAKSTNVAELSRIKEFLAMHGKKTINGVNRQEVQAYLKKFESHAPKTYNHVIGSLKRFFRLAVEQGYILKNPADGFHKRRIPQSLPRFLTDEEYMIIERLALDEGIYPLVVIARYTGMRLRELIHLEWQDFDWERKLVRVLNKPQYGHTIKNFQTRVVPISSELREKLLSYIKLEGLCFPNPWGEPYNHEGPRRAIRKILDKSKLREGKRMGWHDFRHTFASRLAQEGISIYKICKWLGHSDIKTTQIYAHFAPVYDKDIECLSIVDNLYTSDIITATKG